VKACLLPSLKIEKNVKSFEILRVFEIFPRYFRRLPPYSKEGLKGDDRAILREKKRKTRKKERK
jgi:hypothetical protein